MRVSVHAVYSHPCPSVDIEEQPRAGLIEGFLTDADRNEDIYLEHIAKAEIGEPDVIGNHGVWAIMRPGKVVLEEMLRGEAQTDGTEPARTEITLAEAKQLILDWLAAKQRWYAERIKTQ